LHFEEVGDGLVEAFRPKVIAGQALMNCTLPFKT
jgi:hypothetical protein